MICAIGVDEMSNDMNEGAVFSIIVPVYNVSEYLRRCLSSLINQTFKDIEIILVAAGSDLEDLINDILTFEQ